ncbi:MAG: hypothetical protein NT080_00005, partial [Spirochaetes bacterium]|nr:hypothetical protein [Spirochaetota bacterium]
MHDFDAPLDRKNTDCVKWDSLEKTYGSADLIPLWLADPDYSPLIDVRATAFRMLELVETLLPREFHRSRGRRFLHYYCDNF